MQPPMPRPSLAALPRCWPARPGWRCAFPCLFCRKRAALKLQKMSASNFYARVTPRSTAAAAAVGLGYCAWPYSLVIVHVPLAGMTQQTDFMSIADMRALIIRRMTRCWTLRTRLPLAQQTISTPNFGFADGYGRVALVPLDSAGGSP